MKIICIYIIKSAVNSDKIYVGSTMNFLIRKKLHIAELLKNNHGNSRLQNHVNKYGIECLSFEILERVYDLSKLTQREQYYIDSLIPFFNIRRIAENNTGIVRSDETRKRLSDSHMGKKWTIESRKKLSVSNTGRLHSIESKNKMSQVQKGRIVSCETKEKLRQCNLGKKQSAESIQKRVNTIKSSGKKRILSQDARDRLIARNKIAMTPEVRAKISQSLTGKKQTTETIQKRISKTIGGKRTPEMRKRMSDAMKGKPKTKKILATNLKLSA